MRTPLVPLTSYAPVFCNPVEIYVSESESESESETVTCTEDLEFKVLPD